MVMVQAAIDTRAGRVKVEGASVMVAEAATATPPATHPAIEVASGRPDQLSGQYGSSMMRLFPFQIPQELQR